MRPEAPEGVPASFAFKGVLMPEGLSHNPYLLTDLQPVARASAALPAAGAWDAAPTEFFCSGMDHIRLVFTYTRGAAGGAFEFRIETSGESSGATWEQASIYAGAPVVLNADTTSGVQREGIEYGSTAAAAEAFDYGPVELNGTVERMRISARETGAVGSPGTLEIKAFLM